MITTRIATQVQVRDTGGIVQIKTDCFTSTRRSEHLDRQRYELSSRFGVDGDSPKHGGCRIAGIILNVITQVVATGCTAIHAPVRTILLVMLPSTLSVAGTSGSVKGCLG